MACHEVKLALMSSKNEVHIVDTTLSDGQLSLWALGMRTGAMLAIAEQMGRCGFQSMEFFGFAGFIKYVREHKENPFDWIRLGAKKFRNTRLRYHRGLASGFEKVPRSVRKLMIERMVAHGIALTRSSDPWNDYEARVAQARHGRGYKHHLFRLGAAAVKAMLAAGAPKEYLRANQPLVRLIGELAKRRDCKQVYIQKKGFLLRMEKNR